MKFIKLTTQNGDVYVVNVQHIIKLYAVMHNDTTFTRVVLTTGGGMIDTPETVTEVMARIAF